MTKHANGYIINKTKKSTGFLETTEEDESPCFPKLVKRVRFLKNMTKGVKEMCEIFDEVRRGGMLSGWQDAILSLLDGLGTIPGALKESIERQEDENCLRQWLGLAARA